MPAQVSSLFELTTITADVNENTTLCRERVSKESNLRGGYFKRRHRHFGKVESTSDSAGANRARRYSVPDRSASSTRRNIESLILVRVQVETNNPRPCTDASHLPGLLELL